METKKAQQIETQAPGVTEEQIRVHAYYLSLERKGSPADALSDWLRAESDLMARAHAAAKTSRTETPLANAPATRSSRRPAREKAATASNSAPRPRRSKKSEPAGS